MILTDRFGALKGWQWVAVIGGGGAAVLIIRQRAAAKTAAAQAAGTSATGGAFAGAGPFPGEGIISPIIIQQGQPSVNVGPINVPGAPKPTTPPAKPKPPPVPHINAASFPAFISALKEKLVAIPKGGNVKYGAPVYALVPTGYGPVYEQGAAVGAASKKGQTLYTLPQFAQYIVKPQVTSR